MLTVPLDHATEQRLAERARTQGVPISDLLRRIIEDALDDLDDQEMAAQRLANPLPPISSDQARRILDLDD